MGVCAWKARPLRAPSSLSACRLQHRRNHRPWNHMPGSHMRILLVEDEPGLVLTLSDLLSGAGYSVETAFDGISALEKASRQQFDLFILDVMLPGKDGFRVCRELHERGCRGAVLMLTARSQVADRVAGLKGGADDYLV